jgi:uncharacterized membrane protein
MPQAGRLGAGEGARRAVSWFRPMPLFAAMWRGSAMEALFETFAAGVSLACELATALVAAFGAAEALVRVAAGWREFGSPGAKKLIWVRFAAWILLSLEFALAADIVRTAITPSWSDIGHLAAIAAIRTILNLFLTRDIEAYMRDQAGEPGR